ncbi:MAG TPA: mercury methylation ferredoxin HgcB [Spirochaetota bacterium]|mgnify:CR=1 FL=1|nr:mercury methylation ferredoxin HgcB [Spirochaetota bacterium]
MRQKYITKVLSLELNNKLCTGCGMCATVCPHNVFDIMEGKAAASRKQYCMECGACKLNCRFNAISVNSGVGCGYAVIMGAIKGTEPDCGCSSGCC